MSKILAVDNDPFILAFLKDVLTGEGHEVLTAKDGLHAVNVLDEHTPDIIFVDLVMLKNPATGTFTRGRS